jgi:hypothetical protein
MTISPFRTLIDARAQVRAALDEGGTCPCCDQYARRYKRKLNASMAAALCWMWGRGRDRWITVPEVAPAWLLKAREYPKLALWGLIEAKPNASADHKRASGVWRVTDLGAEFVQGCRNAPRFAFVYNGEVDALSQEQTDIRAALGDRFDYAELMGFNRGV